MGSEAPVPDRYLLKLYISGQTPRARQAMQNLRRLCEEELAGCYELEVIDIAEHPWKQMMGDRRSGGAALGRVRRGGHPLGGGEVDLDRRFDG